MSVAEIEAADLQLEGVPSGLWREAWSRLRRNPVAIIGFCLVVFFALVALLAPWIAPYGPIQDVGFAQCSPAHCAGPSAQHWLGLDLLGAGLADRRHADQQRRTYVEANGHTRQRWIAPDPAIAHQRLAFAR